MKRVTILDCTLRDGGYCNDWKFGKNNIRRIVDGLTAANVDYIECGFLTNRQEYDSDRTKYTHLSQISKLLPNRDRKKMHLVMVNYGEYDVRSSYISGVGKPTFFDYYDDLDDKPTPEPKPEPKPSGTVTIALDVLSRGSTGGQVNTVKALLMQFGWSSNLELDGDFDWDTEQAVNTLKDRYDLPQDGIVDESVWRLLLL